MDCGVERSRSSERLLTGLALIVLFAGVSVCLHPAVFPSARQRSLNMTIEALAQHQSGALDLAEKHAEKYPDDLVGLVLASRAAGAQSKHELAIRYLNRLPADGGRWEYHAHVGLAWRHELLGNVAAAERHLRQALELAPNDIQANDHIGHLLQVEGRTWESASHFFLMIQGGKCRGDELLGMATNERFFRSDERLEQAALSAVPPEAVMKLSPARHGLYQNRASEAEILLREIVTSRPDLGEAQGRLGRIIVDRGDIAEFLQWRGSLSEKASRHPEVLFAQGLEARRLRQMEGAIACFLDVLEQSPNHLGANLQIAGCLEQVGRADAAREFSRRSELLSELEGLLNSLRSNVDARLMAKAVSVFAEMGRFWEAAGWSYVMRFLHTTEKLPPNEMRRWLARARAEPGPNAPSMLPARLLDRRDYAAPRWPAPSAAIVEEQSASSIEPAWAFVDDADRLGVRFDYYEGTTEENRLRHIFNVVGGGLAAFDYDLDGWPDLYLAQANNWREPAPQPEHTDRLFRNLHGEGFVDVTALASVGDDSFSHGVTVGDFDQDGFPDVYIGNKGPNRLYRNQGDGTFSDFTSVAGVAGNEWTTSSVFADFNGDGLPDLYVLNYTLLDETAKKECHRSTGEPMACTPDVLLAAPDRCYLNLGNGGFRDVSAESGIRLPDGKGLGVVVWDFAGDGRLGIYVANDTSPSFLFVNEGPDAQGTPRFREEGIVRGVALDVDGNAQASMGVAAGDANGDGRIDLFITTFFGDSKTLFSQRADGFFDDLTRSLNLREAGFWMLGFGCQFADLDGDGWDDLIATNGHVDQRSSRGDADRMPPQVFHNLRGRRFVEVPRAALGAFFLRTYLGRGLATLDWNRDGRTDVGISHLHAPFALLTNMTPATLQPLVVRLIGRSGSREPIGAVVRMKTPGAEQVRLQTAGDGYLVTNERRHQFAIPRGNSTAEIEVRWPGGTLQRWPAIPAGHEVLLIEGRSQPVILRQFPTSAETPSEANSSAN